MKDSDEARHKKAISIKQARRSMMDVTKMSGSSDVSAVSKADVAEWTQSMSQAQQSAEALWEAYLSEDWECFDAVVMRIEPDPRVIRLLLDKAHLEPSPETSSKLGVASADRYAPIKAAIRKDWVSAQAQGTKKSKAQFVRDWVHKQAWSSSELQMTEKALYECLPKDKPKK